MYTFKEAEKSFQKARNKDKGLVLPGRLGQTRLVKTAKGYGIKYVNTIVVEILPNDIYVLNLRDITLHMLTLGANLVGILLYLSVR